MTTDSFDVKRSRQTTFHSHEKDVYLTRAIPNFRFHSFSRFRVVQFHGGAETNWIIWAFAQRGSNFFVGRKKCQKILREKSKYYREKRKKKQKPRSRKLSGSSGDSHASMERERSVSLAPIFLMCEFSPLGVSWRTGATNMIFVLTINKASSMSLLFAISTVSSYSSLDVNLG